MPMRTLKSTLLFVLSVLYIAEIAESLRSCSKGRRKYGCQIENNQCMCGFGCDVIFPYRFRSKCEEHLARIQTTTNSPTEEPSTDPCQPNPCLNLGVCMQQHNGQFNCQCAGTSYYGNRCERACPSSLQQDVYTQEMASCIVI